MRATVASAIQRLASEGPGTTSGLVTPEGRVLAATVDGARQACRAAEEQMGD